MKISIDISLQRMMLLDAEGRVIKHYLISSAKNGVGQEYGSFRTPLGKHVIRAKIGTGQPVNTVFVRRRPTGEIYTPELAERFQGRDWILTRILWLSGCEPKFNRLGSVDTMRRYIYIHGSPDSTLMGKPGSIGCIRMHNHDMLDLYGQVSVGTPVEINL
jgi:lipoprotein-anchoring transpeptidase ErfK/SrfK